MAIVKFITSSCPMNNIFRYITRPEATDRDLIDGINCTPESALDEFLFVKERFGKTDGRQYYHVIQSFVPEENVTPELAHEIGMELIDVANKYTDLKKLTPEVLRVFIAKVVIHERECKWSKTSVQQIDIYFRYIGRLTAEPTKQAV